MRTFATWKSILIQDVADMRRIEGQISFLSLRNTSKRMREIGWHCYQAEEHLTVLELCRLKNELEINDLRWRWYKAQFADRGRVSSFSKFRAIFKAR